MNDPRKRPRGEPAATLEEIAAYKQYVHNIDLSMAQMKASHFAATARKPQPQYDAPSEQMCAVKDNMMTNEPKQTGIVASIEQKKMII